MRTQALDPPVLVLSGGRKRRSRARPVLRAVSSLLIAGGLLLLADAGLTLVWQEPVTAVVGVIERQQIDKHLLSYRTAPLSRADRAAIGVLRSERDRIAYLAARERRQLAAGDAVGVLRLPRMGASFTVVQGTDAGSLEKGPGHYATTALPGLGRTVAIAGHRTTYLAPFRHLDALRAGDEVTLQMPYGRFVYTVEYQRIVPPNAWWITRNAGYERLVLSACNPLFSAAQRIAVFARLTHAVSATPIG
jgi:sortase A